MQTNSSVFLIAIKSNKIEHDISTAKHHSNIFNLFELEEINFVSVYDFIHSI